MYVWLLLFICTTDVLKVWSPEGSETFRVCDVEIIFIIVLSKTLHDFFTFTFLWMHTDIIQRLHDTWWCYPFVVVKSLSRVWLFYNPMDCCLSGPLSMEFSRQEYRSGLPFSPPRESSGPRDYTCVSCIGWWILYHWATKEACYLFNSYQNVWNICKGSPRMLERVAYPFSRGSSRPRNWTRVSCIAGGFFTNWAMREALWKSRCLLLSQTLGFAKMWKVPLFSLYFLGKVLFS